MQIETGGKKKKIHPKRWASSKNWGRIKRNLKKRGVEIPPKILKEIKKDYEERDVKENIPFHCEIGDTQVYLMVHIEPKPHGEVSHAHFHTAIICPKIKIVDVPEPDRCQITNRTCPFIQPLGPGRTERERKKSYLAEISRFATLIEYYGIEKISNKLSEEGRKISKNKLHMLRLFQINMLLHALGLVNQSTYSKLEKFREKRNELLHDKEKFIETREKELWLILEEGQKCLLELSK